MKFYVVALALSRALDAGSSCAAFARGAVEANPMLPHSCAAQVGVQAGASLAQGWMLTKLAPTHPRLARTLAMVTISIEVGVSAHNMRVRP